MLTMGRAGSVKAFLKTLLVVEAILIVIQVDADDAVKDKLCQLASRFTR